LLCQLAQLCPRCSYFCKFKVGNHHGLIAYGCFSKQNSHSWRFSISTPSPYGNSLQGHWKFISSTVKFQFHSFFHVQRCRDAFGCMKLKFGRLEKVELNKLEEICNLIMSTCVLYNFCINVNEYDEELKGKWYGPLVFPNDKI